MQETPKNKAMWWYANKAYYYPNLNVTIKAKTKKDADKKALTTNDKGNATTKKVTGNKG